MKKVATPSDIAPQVVILSSQKVSGHISGQVLMIEGGTEGEYLDMELISLNLTSFMIRPASQ